VFEEDAVRAVVTNIDGVLGMLPLASVCEVKLDPMTIVPVDSDDARTLREALRSPLETDVVPMRL
jgi:hypothetical protein